ncbi:hypothetical protein [Nitrospira defluvii]|uniref:Uncharacterized protein n=1 Tax=Nitrospira defluvii TaxID=330214 RepID=A0ABM8RYV9_9BACT|nr:hypothetical protein [Nitrospira defluvii]CAE6779409.1 hypothetical protein NSPZN2_40679 [Nitrospira defluvii]
MATRPCHHPNRTRRQQDARVRQEDRDTRGPKEQLTRLDVGGYKAVRERTKIAKQTLATKKGKE